MREDIERWIVKQLPEAWVTEPPEVIVDGEEILIVVAVAPTGADAASAAVAKFREATREQRVLIASRTEARFGLVCRGACASLTSATTSRRRACP